MSPLRFASVDMTSIQFLSLSFFLMFKYFILFLSLLTLASCTKTEATPSNAMKQTENASIPSKQTLLYVDVREDEEWAAGHIE